MALALMIQALCRTKVTSVDGLAPEMPRHLAGKQNQSWRLLRSPQVCASSYATGDVMTRDHLGCRKSAIRGRR